MGDKKWPSFIIQGILLATITTFLIKGEGYANTWMFLSLLFVLGLFSLQTTGTEFIYLFPVNTNSEKKIPNYKTHILRIAIMFSIGCLYMGIYHSNSTAKTLTSSPISKNGYVVTLAIALLFLIIVPLLFNFFKNK
ncbi:MAG: hypothetical protein AVO38_11945 [delta proteobacterium ML8_D]|nr:MAG: hypothetical protein AVO38_11945 [delta proteobacterium ML8_D]